MQLPPASVLASWPAANYVNPTHVRGPELIIIAGIFFPLAVLMVILRVFTRIRISKAFGIDDVFLLAALVPTFAITVLTCLAMTKWGWNRHIWDVPLDLVARGLKLTGKVEILCSKYAANITSVALEVLFGVSVSCTKISLLILTRRIMSGGMGALQHVASLGIFVVACEGLVFSLVVIFTCK